MPFWRYLGELPRASSQDEVRTQRLEGWSPWKELWTPSGVPAIIVTDSDDPSRYRRAATYLVNREGEPLIFAAYLTDSGIWRFFVPAASQEAGSFEARQARQEGFWRRRADDADDLPWPEPDESWPDRASFLTSLDRIEAIAEKVAYRGFSPCRLCGCRNGSQSYHHLEWTWPEGFRHYVADHLVRPSEDFETFMRTSARRVES